MQYFRTFLVIYRRMDSICIKLVERLQLGDQQAQQELYNLYAEALLVTAMRYCEERSQAEDVLHDAFIKIFSAIKNFEYRSEPALASWLNRIVVNCAIEQLRLSSRFSLLPLNEAIGSTEEIYNGDEDLDFNIDLIPMSLLQWLVGKLPKGYRTVFNLYCIENYSHREIAEMLGIHEHSSSSQLLRAKRLLASYVKQYIDKESTI